MTNEMNILREGDFSEGVFHKLLSAKLHMLSGTILELQTYDQILEHALDIANLKREIANAKRFPIEKTVHAGKDLSELVRWHHAIAMSECGNWKLMQEELEKEASELIDNPTSPEDVQKGYALQSLSENI